MRFSIRDLLWVTLVVAMGLGWWVEQRATDSASKWRYMAGALEKALEGEGWTVEWHHDWAIVKKHNEFQMIPWIEPSAVEP